jgi:alpha-galactosidase
MSKLAFVGAGSTAFVKNVLGDCMMSSALEGFEFALYDINPQKLEESRRLLNNLKESMNANINIKAYDNRKDAMRGAKYVVNAIYVGAKERIYLQDFEIPSKYGLRQTIGDTVGVGGLFRALRTIPVMMDMAKDMEEVCPDAWLMNYTNPMPQLTGAVGRYSGVKTVGLCHSVQVAAPSLLKRLDMSEYTAKAQWKMAGINHMAWLLEISHDGEDLYPEIMRRAREKQRSPHDDSVRFELMLRFGYYVSESTTHHAEYHPYFIKRQYPELIERFGIPLDQHPKNHERRAVRWEQMKAELLNDTAIRHVRSREYASHMIEAMETDIPYRIAGNVVNTGYLIDNLPQTACVEVPCLVDRNGVTPCRIGSLPEQLAGLNRTNINTQLMAIEAAISGRKDAVYQAAFLDPHTSAELSLDDIVSVCDELLEVNRPWIGEFK